MRSRVPSARGGILLIALILLAVLSVLGVAAVSLGSRERQNASAKARVDSLLACAQAARAQVWAEVARYGPGYFSSTRTLDAPIDLTGYGQLAAPAHYDSTTAMRVDQVVVGFDGGASDGAPAPTRDLTNAAPGMDSLLGGRAWRLAARCTDSRGNKFEVEFSMRFALF
ncbi:MAG TPA: type II secretion system protein [Anaeromyxobacter sp.]|nr:type II secretion system protein [Anaeromyxobacter sp.]